MYYNYLESLLNYKWLVVLGDFDLVGRRYDLIICIFINVLYDVDMVGLEIRFV